MITYFPCDQVIAFHSKLCRCDLHMHTVDVYPLALEEEDNCAFLQVGFLWLKNQTVSSILY